MITEGLILLGMGMGFVFLFLIILIFGTKLMSAIILKFFPEKEIPVKQASGSSQSVNTEIAIAIAAAKAYANKKN